MLPLFDVDQQQFFELQSHHSGILREGLERVVFCRTVIAYISRYETTIFGQKLVIQRRAIKSQARHGRLHAPADRSFDRDGHFPPRTLAA